jgi:hypothetical protein
MPQTAAIRHVKLVLVKNLTRCRIQATDAKNEGVFGKVAAFAIPRKELSKPRQAAKAAGEISSPSGPDAGRARWA